MKVGSKTTLWQSKCSWADIKQGLSSDSVHQKSSDQVSAHLTKANQNGSKVGVHSICDLGLNKQKLCVKINHGESSCHSKEKGRQANHHCFSYSVGRHHHLQSCSKMRLRTKTEDFFEISNFLSRMKKGGSLTCPDFFSWCSISLSSHSTCLRMLCSEQPLKYIKAFLASSNRPLDTSHLGLGSEAAKTMNWATGTTHADNANQFQSSTDPNE